MIHSVGNCYYVIVCDRDSLCYGTRPLIQCCRCHVQVNCKHRTLFRRTYNDCGWCYNRSVKNGG